MVSTSDAGSDGSTARKTGEPQHLLYLRFVPHQQGALRCGGHEVLSRPVSASEAAYASRVVRLAGSMSSCSA